MYKILMTLLGDSVGKVDKFIVRHQPQVEQTQHPRETWRSEPIYSRLRKQYAHHRRDTSLEETRADMAKQLGGLFELAKKAIDLHMSTLSAGETPLTRAWNDIAQVLQSRSS